MSTTTSAGTRLRIVETFEAGSDFEPVDGCAYDRGLPDLSVVLVTVFLISKASDGVWSEWRVSSHAQGRLVRKDGTLGAALKDASTSLGWNRRADSERSDTRIDATIALMQHCEAAAVAKHGAPSWAFTRVGA